MEEPSDAEVQKCTEKMHESLYVCGDHVDVLKKFATNEKLHCSDDVEIVYYPALADSKVGAVVVCFSCVTKIPEDIFVK